MKAVSGWKRAFLKLDFEERNYRTIWQSKVSIEFESPRYFCMSKIIFLADNRTKKLTNNIISSNLKQLFLSAYHKNNEISLSPPEQVEFSQINKLQIGTLVYCEGCCTPTSPWRIDRYNNKTLF